MLQACMHAQLLLVFKDCTVLILPPDASNSVSIKAAMQAACCTSAQPVEML